MTKQEKEFEMQKLKIYKLNNSIPEYNSSELYPHSNILSSSQVLDYLKSPSHFYAVNHLGARHESPAMRIGQIFSAWYANRSLDCRPLLKEAGAQDWLIERFERALACLPVMAGFKPETALYCVFKKWKFRASLDNFSRSKFIIIENKTGQMPWTQARVDQSDQITFQTWVHWRKFKRLPSKIFLIWIDTRKSATELMHTFETARHPMQLKYMEERIAAVIKNIETGNFTTPI
jgi:hypothetical protein